MLSYFLPSILRTIIHGAQYVETLIYLPQKEEGGVGGDGGALEIDPHGTVEIRPDHSFQALTNIEHLRTPYILNIFH